jgi:hypothetical protein
MLIHEKNSRHLTPIQLHNTAGQQGFVQQTMYNILNKEGDEDTDNNTTVVTQTAAAATTGSTIGSTYAATTNITIPVKVMAAIYQLSANQAASCSKWLQCCSAPHHQLQHWHSTYPHPNCNNPRPACISGWSIQPGHGQHVQCRLTLGLVTAGAVDVGDTDAIRLPTTWLILAMGWDSSCNTVEASLGQHYLEI